MSDLYSNRKCTHTRALHRTKEMRKRRVYIYDHMGRGVWREKTNTKEEEMISARKRRRKEERHPGTERRRE